MAGSAGVTGITGAFAVVLLYACLAIGPMSILSPILALVAAVIPITIGFVRGARLSGLGYLGLAVGLVAVGVGHLATMAGVGQQEEIA